MMKYHNQTYVIEMAQKICMQSRDVITKIIEDLKKLQEEAQIEYDAINEYTAPEEVENRTQTLYYYDDLLELLSVTLF